MATEVKCEMPKCKIGGSLKLCFAAGQEESQNNCEDYWPDCGFIAWGDSECTRHGEGSGECRPLLCDLIVGEGVKS